MGSVTGREMGSMMRRVAPTPTAKRNNTWMSTVENPNHGSSPFFHVACQNETKGCCLW